MKKHIFLLALNATLAVAAMVSSCDKEDGPRIPTDKLVAYYPFDGNAQDESEHNKHGNIYPNGVQFVSNRKNENNKAISFNGKDGFIEVPNSGFINFGSEDFTISLWLKFGDQDDIRKIENDILIKWTSDSGNYPFAVRLRNQTANDGTQGAWWAGRWDGGGGTCENLAEFTSPESIDDNQQFHHVVFVKKVSFCMDIPTELKP